MKKRILYIIGNGFDLYHGISSRYADFEKYVEIHDRDLHSTIEQYFDSYLYWSSIEQALADFDADLLKQNSLNFLMSYGADDWSDSYHHDYQNEINSVTEKLSGTLIGHFKCWLCQLDIPDSFVFKEKLNYIDNDGIYLTFNYTNTLNKIYSVPNSRILFIHGKAVDEDSNLILGHAWNPKERQKMYNDDYSEQDIRVIEGNEIIDSYFERTYKPTHEIINNNLCFFAKLHDIEIIYILGHSISKVDMEYFKKIFQSIDSSTVQWKVSYYDDSELDDHKSTMRKLGLSDSLTEFHKLSNMPKS